jgi:hypothetical protein
MKIATVKLKSASPYSQGRYHATPKLNKESDRDYEDRTWRERVHSDPKTAEVFIPPMAFKNCLSEAARFLSVQIPGKGKSTYTKHFEAGLLIKDIVPIGIKKQDLIGETFFVPADGKRGGGKRVLKTFPMVPEWQGVLTAYVLDDTITEDVFRQHLEQAGQFIGVGRFRPRNNGYYGRFDVQSIDWKEVA